MLPSYKRNRALSLFFVIFLTFNNMILLNLTLNVLYVYYKETMSKNLDQIIDSSVKEKRQPNIKFIKRVRIFYLLIILENMGQLIKKKKQSNQ